MFKSHTEYSFTKGCAFITLSVLIFSVIPWLIWLNTLRLKQIAVHDSKYHIIALIQRSISGDALSTLTLSELLDLSIDRPQNLYRFDVKKGIDSLVKFPLIKKADIKKIPPGSLYVEYLMRKPIAYCLDCVNSAIDAEGVIFPFHPFFTPKILPTLYFGLNQVNWGDSMEEKVEFRVAMRLLSELATQEMGQFSLQKIDLSRMLHEKEGQREIVVVLQKQQDSRTIQYFLRLKYANEMINQAYLYTILQALENSSDQKLQKHKNLLIDLRVPHYAYISIQQP